MTSALQLLKLPALLVIALLLVAAWTQTSAPRAYAIFDDTDGDGALDMEEELAGSDPDDFSSVPESTGAEFIASFPVCSDDLDNDGDGLTDDDDPNCTDSDGDIVSDPVEEQLGSDPDDSTSFPEDSRIDAILEYRGIPIPFCGDALDNDGDGLVDGDDPGCESIAGDADDFDNATEKRWGSDPDDSASVPEHETPNPGSCDDGLDNDLDGLTDDADPACGIPDNDDRANAIEVASLPYTDGPRIVKNATAEDDEPRSSCIFASSFGTTWYSYTAAEDARLIGSLANGQFEAVLTVFRADGDALTEVGCEYGYSTRPSRIVFDAAAGETYFFQLTGYPFDPVLPTFTFSLEAGTPPPNDDFEDATEVTALPFSDSVDVSAAGTQFGEPGGCFGEPRSSVWYSFVPSDDGLLVADSEGSGYAAVINVWTETVFGLAQVSCNTSYGGGEDARLAFEAEAGRAYFFQVNRFPYSFSPEAFDLTFNLEVGVPPANDNFADATVVSSLPFTDSVDTLTATTEPGEPARCDYYEVTRSVWYRYTPADDTIVLAHTEGSDGPGALIGVYEGTSLADLEVEACAQPGYPDTRIALQLDGGEDYFFQVSSAFFGPVVPFPIAGAEEPSEAAGFPGGGTSLVFNLEELDVPDCPTPASPISDPVGDFIAGPFGPIPEDAPRADIVSVGTSSTEGYSCLTVEFADAIEPWDAQSDESVFATMGFDTDINPNTGYRDEVGYNCTRAGRLGFEASLYMYGGTGLIFEMYAFGDVHSVIGTFDERSFTLAVPLAALGGDGDYTYAIAAGSARAGISDCAPDGGVLRAPEPATMGDANCDGETNALDSTLMLQLFADLIDLVPCQNVADVNESTVIGPIDAQLVLQYDAGLLSSLGP